MDRDSVTTVSNRRSSGTSAQSGGFIKIGGFIKVSIARRLWVLLRTSNHRDNQQFGSSIARRLWVLLRLLSRPLPIIAHHQSQSPKALGPSGLIMAVDKNLQMLWSQSPEGSGILRLRKSGGRFPISAVSIARSSGYFSAPRAAGTRSVVKVSIAEGSGTSAASANWNMTFWR